MALFEVRPAVAIDLPRLMAIDHASTSDYVWQLELRRESGQMTANFREVRLPRSIQVVYPRNPFSLGDEWTSRGVVLVVLQADAPIGYISVDEERTSAAARVRDIVVAPEVRRRGAGSALLTAAQEWALERQARRMILEMQSKNQGCIRLAQKFGYEFCGYNDQYYPTQDVALFFGRALK